MYKLPKLFEQEIMNQARLPKNERFEKELTKSKKTKPKAKKAVKEKAGKSTHD